MDEYAFKETLREVNARHCHFAKSILSQQATCEFAEKFYLAEREGINCRAFNGELRCRKWLDFLQENCRFALKLDNPLDPLPHGKAMKLQIGGLIGLYETLYNESIELPIDNINEIISHLFTTHKTLSSMPLTQILPAIAAYQTKKRSRKHR